MSRRTVPPAPQDLDEAWDHAWQHLVRALRDRRHAFRTPTLSTVAADGTPRSRVVVLRGADKASGTLVFHTDARSDKLDDLPRGVAWCFYSHKARLQLRARGPVQVQTIEHPDAAAAWERTSPMGRRTYLCEPGPGTALDAPASGLEHLDGEIEPSEEEAAPGREVFRRVVCTVQHLERLDLAIEGHRRSLHGRQPDGSWSRTWVVP